MSNKNLKLLIFTSAIVLLAAGCNGSSQTTSSNTAPTSPPPYSASSTGSGMPGNASLTRGGFGMRNLPAGTKPFFGTIASVSGSQITLSGRSRNSSSTVTTIINVSGSTQYQQGGSQSGLVAGVRIVGYGTANSYGSINAQNLTINPSLPQGGQGGGYHGNGGGQAQPQ